MNLLGILSEKDVLGLFYTLREAENKKVEDFMTQPAVHFDQNESLMEACNCLIANSFRRVPVTSDNKVVGIISRPDVIRYILQMKENPVPAYEL